VPLTAPLKLMALVEAVLQTDWPVTEFTVGVGLTVIVKVFRAPGQLFAEGVTEITPCIGELPLFVPAKARILPVPLEARPMDVLLLAQV
jgi:hypothetical protein